MHPLEVTLPGLASSVPPARRFVERTLAEWELDALSWTAALVVTELAANAALHAGTEFTVRLARRGARVRLEVHDRSADLPRQRSHSAESTTGRGLRLVADLAADWGVQSAAGGKTIWVELAIDSSRGGDHDEQDPETLLEALSDDVDEPGVAGQGRAFAQAA